MTEATRREMAYCENRSGAHCSILVGERLQIDARFQESCAECRYRLALIERVLAEGEQRLQATLESVGIEVWQEDTPQPDGTVDRFGTHWKVTPQCSNGAQAPTLMECLPQILEGCQLLVQSLEEERDELKAAPLPAGTTTELNKRIERGMKWGQILGPDYDGVSVEDVLREFVQLKAAAPQGWQPITSAPKDRLIIGALIRDGVVWRVHEMKHNGLAFYTKAGGSLPAMTHWLDMPLPDPPKEPQ